MRQSCHITNFKWSLNELPIYYLQQHRVHWVLHIVYWSQNKLCTLSFSVQITQCDDTAASGLILLTDCIIWIFFKSSSESFQFLFQNHDDLRDRMEMWKLCWSHYTDVKLSLLKYQGLLSHLDYRRDPICLYCILCVITIPDFSSCSETHSDCLLWSNHITLIVSHLVSPWKSYFSTSFTEHCVQHHQTPHKFSIPMLSDILLAFRDNERSTLSNTPKSTSPHHQLYGS